MERGSEVEVAGVDPRGDVAAKLGGDEPGVLTCDVDLEHARDDDHIRDRRPELYRAITEPREERGR
ncbi:MAG: hypothetical protein HY721_00710 [Planctomycetes bacterium]|nr:hypothetical protein [Planctomycetota bacterium]